MPPKARMTLRSNFPAAKRAMWGATQAARDKALDAGEAEAEKKLERLNDMQGYNLPTEVEQETLGHQSGRIFYEPFYGRWFEYGSVLVSPSPFMRPAHNRMRKVFLSELGDEAPKWIRRKAAIR